MDKLLQAIIEQLDQIQKDIDEIGERLKKWESEDSIHNSPACNDPGQARLFRTHLEPIMPDEYLRPPTELEIIDESPSILDDDNSNHTDEE